MIEINRNKNYFETFEHLGNGNDLPCVICGRGCKNPVHYVRVFWGSHAVKGNEAEEIIGREGAGGDMGWFPIGVDCLRKHPELKSYTDDAALYSAPLDAEDTTPLPKVVEPLLPPDLIAIASPMERVGWYVCLEMECRLLQADVRDKQTADFYETGTDYSKKILAYDLLSPRQAARLKQLENWLEVSRPALPDWYIPDQMEYLRQEMTNWFSRLVGQLNWEIGEAKVTKNEAYSRYVAGKREVLESTRLRVYNIWSRLNRPRWYIWDRH